MGLVTNDQVQGLMDTAATRLARNAVSKASEESVVDEITGGLLLSLG